MSEETEQTVAIPVNAIDLVSFDLQDTEGLERTIRNLENLQKTYGSLTGTLEDKIVFQQKKITELIERIKLCKRKIQALSNLQVAMKFESPAKFPKKYKFQQENRQALFQSFQKISYKDVIQSQEFKPKLVSDPSKHGKHPEIFRDEISQIVQLKYSKFKPRRKNIFEGQNAITKKIKNYHQNMGEVPRNMKYTDNLLVFNTKVNPYRHYIPIDNLKTFEQNQKVIQKPKEKNQNDISLFEAPNTIANSERLTQYKADDTYYKPEFKAIPQMQFDTGLNDFLGGVVSLDVDMNHNDDFIPSKGGVIQRQRIQDPNLNPAQNKPESIAQQPLQQLQQQQSQPVQQQQQQYQSQQQQQPPPVIQQQQPQISNSNIPLPPPITIQPQQQTASNMQQQQAVNKPQAPAPPQKQGGGINDLMEQIRNPAVKLRKRETKESGGINIGKKKNDVESADAGSKAPGGGGGGGGGSIMDQLKKQIEKRYQAIHVKQDKNVSKKKKNKQIDESDEEEEENSEEDSD